MPTPQALDLNALRALCESVYQPTEERLRVVAAHDWSGYPRIARTLGKMAAPWTRDAVSAVAAEVLAAAAADLASAFPERSDRLSPLEVFRLHVLEQAPWPAIEAQLAEEGRPASRQTLIRRQREMLPFILEWAATDDVETHAIDDDAAITRDDAPRPERTRRRWAMWAALALVPSLVLAGQLLSAFTGDGDPGSIDAAMLGRMIAVDGRSTLPAPHSAVRVPHEIGAVTVAMVLEIDPGERRVLFGYTRAGDPTARLRLVDPANEATVWDLGFDPPREQRITHAGVGAEVVDQSYEPWQLFHAGPEGDLGRYVVMVAKQHWSPTFVAFVDLHAGTIAGHYVHPGMLPRGLVVDVNRDGAQDVVLGGCDNAEGLPVVVALQPGPWVGAASTVQWNESGREDALARVLLPDVPAARRALDDPRLAVSPFLETSSFDAGTRVLRVGVGGVDRETERWVELFHVRLGDRLRPDPERTITLWDFDERNLIDLGVDPASAPSWADSIVHLEGPLRAPAETDVSQIRIPGSDVASVAAGN